MGKLVFAAAALLVIAGLALGSALTPDSLVPLATDLPPGPCTTSVPTPGAGSHLVLVFGGNSTAEVCIRYSNSLGNEIHDQIYSEAHRVNSTSPLTFSNVPPSELNSTPWPSSFGFTSGGTSQSQVVEFTITPGPTVASGVYALFFDQICTGVPLVIGTLTPGEIIAKTDFYPSGTSFGCPAILMQAQIVGVSGLQILVVP